MCLNDVPNFEYKKEKWINTFQQIFSKIEGVKIGKENVAPLFGRWYENKKDFIKWLNNQLIYEFPNVEFHLSNERREELIYDFITQADNYLYYNDKDYSINLEKYYKKLYEFIERNKQTFFENLVSDEFWWAENFVKINPGMKLSKAFKFFIEDKESLTQIQQIASSYIQKDKIKGTLCISVHPYDYLTLSENLNNWRSCHALDGEYCAGNLSYMLDKCTVICYLQSEKKEHLRFFPDDILWNNKKWRMLIHFGEDKNHIFLGRQYPFEIDGILKFLQEKVFHEEYFPFQNDFIDHLGNMNLSDKQIALSDGYRPNLYSKYEVVQDESPLHYNDLLKSSFYEPYYTSKIRIYKKILPRVRVGSQVDCVMCGKDEISPGNKTFLCRKCALNLADYIECYCCGELVHYDDARELTDPSNNYICQRCYEDGEAYYCGNCDGFYLREDMEWSYKYETYYCQDCFEDIKEEEYEYRKKEGYID